MPKEWYVLHTRSGMEEKVKRALDRELEFQLMEIRRIPALNQDSEGVIHGKITRLDCEKRELELEVAMSEGKAERRKYHFSRDTKIVEADEVISCEYLKEGDLVEIRGKAENPALKKWMGTILLPVQIEERETPRGKRIVRNRPIYPRYVFIEMDYNPESRSKLSRWLRKTEGVLNLIGGWENPQPLTDEEINDILRKAGVEPLVSEIHLHPGDEVRILGGAFSEFSGTVEEVDKGRKRVRVLVNLFGRETPVELSLEQVRKK